MKNNEEEIQRKVEEGLIDSNQSIDARAYEHVFRALRTEPPFELRDNFADKVVSIVELKRKPSGLGEFFWLGIGIISLLLAAVITIAMLRYSFDLGFLKGLSAYKGVLIFGIAFVIFLHVVDRKVLTGRHHAA